MAPGKHRTLSPAAGVWTLQRRVGTDVQGGVAPAW